MRWSFVTDGNYIKFVHTDETNRHVQQTIHRLHNTSRCIDWSLPDDTTRISFTIDETRYENVSIYDIDFDGVQMNVQGDFETGITAMFTGLAGGSLLVATKTLTNDQIIHLPTTGIQIVASPGSGKFINLINGVLVAKIVANYTNLSNTSLMAFDIGGTPISNYVLNDNVNFFELNNLIAPGNGKTILSILSQYNYASDVAGGNWGNPALTYDTAFLGNNPLKIIIDNGAGGILTGGDIGNSLKVTAYYTIETYS